MKQFVSATTLFNYYFIFVDKKQWHYNLCIIIKLFVNCISQNTNYYKQYIHIIIVAETFK